MVDLSNRSQFESAYRRFAPLARRVAQTILRDHVAAEDVVQDVFLHLWRRPRSYDPARGTLATYVALLAQSRSLDRRRSSSARDSACRRLAEESRVHHEPAGLEEPALARERRRQLLTALGGLPPEQRDAVLLAFGRGLTAREIAFHGNLPLGSAKSRIRLGLAKAREQLNEAA
jgi:RNA polymerase sigma-70 factor (ECF subfamily)